MKIVYTGEMDKRLCKEVLGATIEKIVTEDENTIYLDADLMSCSGTLKWAKQHPDRAIDCGIAESNMAGVAAGLAVAGYRPIIHSFGPFASRRCFDQIFEDVALYNVIPGSTVIDVSDPTCLESVLKQCVYRPGIKYIRVGRKQMARIYEDGSELPIGKAVTLREGTDAVIFAAGIMLHEALQAAQSLEKQGVSVAVVDCFTIKPLDREAVIDWARKTGAVVVAENANRHGGLYTTVLEALAEECPVPAACVAIEDEFGEVGTQGYLQKRFGLTAAHIEEQVKTVIARKKA